MRRLVVGAVVAIAGCALPAGASAQTSLRFFQTPSHNIGCAYSAAPGSRPFLRCDLRVVERPAPRPPSCRLDYGSAFGLARSGRARRLCVGDTVLKRDAKVLRYGAARRDGPFRCVSRVRGLRCTARSGHGFFLSRRRQRLF
jgi:hypothetical protein